MENVPPSNGAKESTKSSQAKKTITKPKTVLAKPHVWHKHSVSMKMKCVPFLQNRKPIRGFMVKFKKAQQIYAFRCVKEDEDQKFMAQHADNDTVTDDEQLFIAQKQMFMNLCSGLEQEILDDQNKTQS